MLCVLVPEVEGSVRAGSAEGTVNRVKGDCVDGVDTGDVAVDGVLLAVAFEREVETEIVLVRFHGQMQSNMVAEAQTP